MHDHDWATDWRHFDFACQRVSSVSDVGSTHTGFQDRSSNKGAQSVKMKDMRDQHVIFGINTRNAWGKLTTATAGQRAHVACPIECPLISNVKGAPSGTWISLCEKVETVPSFVPRWRDLLSSESTFFVLSLSQCTQKKDAYKQTTKPFLTVFSIFVYNETHLVMKSTCLKQIRTLLISIIRQ